MKPNDRTLTRLWAAPALQRLVASVAVSVLVVSCGSDSNGRAGTTLEARSAATAETATSANPANPDQALADAILLAPDDLGGQFRALPPEGDWPYSAEVARKAPACLPYADLVFGGGAHHAPSSTVTLQRGADTLYTYVVVFPTSEEAAALMSAVESPEFDDCWSQYVDASAVESAYKITEAHYNKTTPPDMMFDAERYVARMVRGTIKIDGAELGDSCVCVFVQVGRAMVLVHSAAEQFSTEDRVAITQTAIDKAKRLIE